MLEFHEITIDDRAWMAPILRESGQIGYDAAFGTRYIWGGKAGSRWSRWEDSLFFRSGKDKPAYSFPFGGDLKRAVGVMREDAAACGAPFCLRGVTEDQKAALEEAFPGRWDWTEDRDSADYVYLSQDLIGLAGRKYHGKRNHLAKFSRAYAFTYEDVTRENLVDCETVARAWCAENGGCGEDSGLDKEHCAMRRTFAHFEALGFTGGLIRIGGAPVAFTIGEEINAEAYDVHFEKALGGYDGLYPAINHEFASRRLGGYRYINREEDMGIEGLRRAKLSYYPAIVLMRYRAVWKDGQR